MAGLIALLHTLLNAIVTFFIVLGSLVTSHTTVVIPPAPVATTTRAVGATSTPSTSTSTPAKTPSVATSTPIKVPVPTAPAAATSTPAAPKPAFNADALNTLARASLANVLCTTAAGGSFNPISGSGVIIDHRGVILTNAHVGQYFLLRNYGVDNNVQCTIRTGSPAQPRYTAELLYLPPQWIADNASKITQQSPTGTGETDYAFLYITGTTNPQDILPTSFPALPMDGAEPQTGDQMLLAAYPAGFLGGIAITLNLYITSAVATVGQLYNFADPNNVDLFSLGGTIVSQSGSSGGAVVNAKGELNGLIVTEIPADTTSGRDLRALTIAHINRSLATEGQGGIATLLSQNVASFAAIFNAKVAPAETQALVNALNGN